MGLCVRKDPVKGDEAVTLSRAGQQDCRGLALRVSIFPTHPPVGAKGSMERGGEAGARSSPSPRRAER